MIDRSSPLPVSLYFPKVARFNEHTHTQPSTERRLLGYVYTHRKRSVRHTFTIFTRNSNSGTDDNNSLPGETIALLQEEEESYHDSKKGITTMEDDDS